ncbi:CBASS cGAMP-activated phospholipase [Geobacter argillaceus]|uniref:PNPLA domain-containing protein n=1 Tax=Geobacter argillaceus TaxID=345631 RepID=A0A562VP87_9BACT|nr:CBASS cGAMP-activated phospholipase [Geobacter argillaceus]TWJ19719.1 hypothetical protein JN12_01520 [Geobacter argillaceus]
MSFKILSIDGGGFRGLYAAHILERMEDVFGELYPKFDLIAGTSTGSIIASSICCRISAKEISQLYIQHGKKIFSRKLHTWIPFTGGLFTSQYHNQHLYSLLLERFSDVRLGEIEKPLIVPATDIGNGTVHVFKSGYDKGFYRDTNVLVADAVLASCAAPMYFDPVMVSGKYCLSDGGLWANSPALVAVIDAHKRLGIDFKDIKILTIGSGTVNEMYSQKPNVLKLFAGWGFLTKWGRKKFINTLLHLQSTTANNMLGLILQREQIMRIDFPTDKEMPLDDVSLRQDLLSRADKDFTHLSAQIRGFLEIP